MEQKKKSENNEVYVGSRFFVFHQFEISIKNAISLFSRVNRETKLFVNLQNLTSIKTFSFIFYLM